MAYVHKLFARMNKCDPQAFQRQLSKYFADFQRLVSTDKGDWTVKGFIDIYRNIYTISLDTKVVSKIVELLIFPEILRFAAENDYQCILTMHQNHYPDVTFIHRPTKAKIALDLKSTYRTSPTKVNGMTLGAFTGYFRNRDSTKMITFPYSQYTAHFILGVIYTKTDLYNAKAKVEALGITLSNKTTQILAKYVASPSDDIFATLIAALGPSWSEKQGLLRSTIDECLVDEQVKYSIEQLPSISSVVRDFEFFVQEKWKIACDRPGSGNTKNIGSSQTISDLVNGTGLFTKHENGEAFFNDYWMNYLTKEMAQVLDLDEPHYTNFKGYLKHKEKLKNVIPSKK